MERGTSFRYLGVSTTQDSTGEDTTGEEDRATLLSSQEVEDVQDVTKTSTAALWRTSRTAVDHAMDTFY